MPKEKLKTNKDSDIWVELLTQLNSEIYNTTLDNFKELIKTCANLNAYYTCQCIVYMCCIVNSNSITCRLASVLISPYISGQEYSKAFYSRWDQETQSGGVVNTPQDMTNIMRYFSVHNPIDMGNIKLTNAMKKGFKKSLETFSSIELLKDRYSIIDIINLVHPKSSNQHQQIMHKGKFIFTLDAIIQGVDIDIDNIKVNTKHRKPEFNNPVDHLHNISEVRIV